MTGEAARVVLTRLRELDEAIDESHLVVELLEQQLEGITHVCDALVRITPSLTADAQLQVARSRAKIRAILAHAASLEARLHERDGPAAQPA